MVLGLRSRTDGLGSRFSGDVDQNIEIKGPACHSQTEL